MSRSPSPHEPDASSGDEQASLSHQVLETLVTTAHAVYRYADERLGRYKPRARLSGSRLRVLAAVGKAGSLRMGDLAAELGVAARTVTHLVDELEKEELLVRRSDPKDRRATLLELSPSMRTRWEEFCVLQRALTDEILAPLDAAERRQLFDLLTRLKEGPIRNAVHSWWDDADRPSSEQCGGPGPGTP